VFHAPRVSPPLWVNKWDKPANRQKIENSPEFSLDLIVSLCYFLLYRRLVQYRQENTNESFKKHDVRLNEILDAAEALFVQKGYELVR
jgi:hypothetical protein